eukprot:jgi/Mesen1/4319/ME000022S03612
MHEDEDPSVYINRLAKLPRLSRRGSLPAKADQLAASRVKQPRALEEGNWICDDVNCANVNYPRRTECNKCGKRRGPSGDAVVKAYVETIKLQRGELPNGTSMLPPDVLEMGDSSHAANMGRALVASASQALSGMLPEHDVWMAGGYEAQSQQILQQQAQALQQQQQEHVSLAAQYIAGDAGRRSFSATLEGKRLAEQLVASFAASADPIGDAGECLASATLWLQQMKQRMLQVPPSLDMALHGAADLGPGVYGSVSTRSPGPSSTLQRYNSFADGGWAGPGSLAALTSTLGGSGNLQSMKSLAGVGSSQLGGTNGLVNGAGLGYGTGTAGGGGIGTYMGGLGDYAPTRRQTSGVLASQGSGRLVIPRPSVRYEDFKDKPSDYLREFGDPAAMNAAGGGGGNQRPESGVNGNWECEDCKNVNFPRRSNCFQCHKKRGVKGEEIVREYVRRLIEGH